ARAVQAPALARPQVTQGMIQIIDCREEIFSEILVPAACAPGELDIALLIGRESGNPVVE
ncbi:MAG: hypothetical protein VST68_06340, partial [Nitrospirota bacterium]|nr:hypothetical protein [Nitrospirota bacterium]